MSDVELLIKNWANDDYNTGMTLGFDDYGTFLKLCEEEGFEGSWELFNVYLDTVYDRAGGNFEDATEDDSVEEAVEEKPLTETDSEIAEDFDFDFTDDVIADDVDFDEEADEFDERNMRAEQATIEADAEASLDEFGIDYDRRAVERLYGLEDGELDGIDIDTATVMVGEEPGALDQYIINEALAKGDQEAAENIKKDIDYYEEKADDQPYNADKYEDKIDSLEQALQESDTEAVDDYSKYFNESFIDEEDPEDDLFEAAKQIKADMTEKAD